MFKEILNRLIENTPGAQAAMVIGYDGIPLSEAKAAQAAGLDLQAVAIEYCGIISEIKKNAVNLGAQNVQEISVRAEGCTILIRLINADYFMILALSSDAYFGKGRFLLRHASSEVLGQL